MTARKEEDHRQSDCDRCWHNGIQRIGEGNTRGRSFRRDNDLNLVTEIMDGVQALGLLSNRTVATSIETPRVNSMDSHGLPQGPKVVRMHAHSASSQPPRTTKGRSIERCARSETLGDSSVVELNLIAQDYRIRF